MKGQRVVERLVLVLLVVAVCAVLWLWWMILAQQAEEARLSGELAEARGLRREFVRLRELQETMRADLQGLCERVVEGTGREEPIAGTRVSDDIPVSALHRLATMLEQQNKELAVGLQAAEKRIAETEKKLDETRALLNQTTVELTRTKTELTVKTTELAGTQTKLSDHQEQVKSQKADLTKLQEQIAALITERGKLLGEKKKLDADVKTLTKAESDHSTTIAGLQTQLDQSKEETGKLAKQVKTAGTEIAALKKQIEALKKKLETSAD